MYIIQVRKKHRSEHLIFGGLFQRTRSDIFYRRQKIEPSVLF